MYDCSRNDRQQTDNTSALVRQLVANYS